MGTELSLEAQKWGAFYLKFEETLKNAGRSLGEVQILPVSKTRSAEELIPWLNVGGFPQILGENYFSELEEKRVALKGQFPHLCWHFIGPLQSRKIPDLCKVASCLHTVSRIKELKILQKIKAAGASVPKFYIQVNVSEEIQKNGCSPEELPGILEDVENLKLGNNLEGLMCLPSSVSEVGEKVLRKQFSLLRSLRDSHLPNGKLSMGMSEDFEWAIKEGSNLIRVGSALFGERK